MWNREVFISLQNKWYYTAADWLNKWILLLVLLWWNPMHASIVEEITKERTPCLTAQIKNRRINKGHGWSYSSNLIITKLGTESKSPEFQSIHVIKAAHKESWWNNFSSDFVSLLKVKRPQRWLDFRSVSAPVHPSCSKDHVWVRVPGNQDPDPTQPLVFWSRNSPKSAHLVYLLQCHYFL